MSHVALVGSLELLRHRSVLFGEFNCLAAPLRISCAVSTKRLVGANTADADATGELAANDCTRGFSVAKALHEFFSIDRYSHRSLHRALNCACGAGSCVAARQRLKEGNPLPSGWFFSCARSGVAETYFP